MGQLQYKVTIKIMSLSGVWLYFHHLAAQFPDSDDLPEGIRHKEKKNVRS